MRRSAILKAAATSLCTVGMALSFASAGSAAVITGGTTDVALNSTTVSTLVGLGFSISAVSPATLTGLNAAFPITGGNTTTDITHSGGLAVKEGATTTDLNNFVINISSDTLSGNVNGGSAEVTFFDLGTGGALTLDPTLAAALTSIYGVPNLSGASIGTATVNATTATGAATPEPTSLALAGLGLAAAGVAARRRRKTA